MNPCPGAPRNHALQKCRAREHLRTSVEVWAIASRLGSNAKAQAHRLRAWDQSKGFPVAFGLRVEQSDTSLVRMPGL